MVVLTRDVAAHATEGLGEGPHHHVHVLRVHAAVLAGSPPRLAQRSDAVRLVEVNVRLLSQRLANRKYGEFRTKTQKKVPESTLRRSSTEYS